MKINELPCMDLSDNPYGCCPRFHPEAWDEKTFELVDMLFAKDHSLSFFHMPLNLGKVMTRSQQSIDAVNGQDPERYLILSTDVSNWKTNHYFKVSKIIPGMEMKLLSGTYLTKVYDSSFKELPKLIVDFKSYVSAKNELIKELFIFYTTCPKCSQKYKHNYMVFFAKT